MPHENYKNGKRGYKIGYLDKEELNFFLIKITC